MMALQDAVHRGAHGAARQPRTRRFDSVAPIPARSPREAVRRPAGERFDGHEFVAEVPPAGAAAAMVDAAGPPAMTPGLPLLVVDDTRLRWAPSLRPGAPASRCR
jgi:UDP-N-acetylmuramyl pentapeptide synthase